MFQHVDIYPGDPILSLVDTFKKIPAPTKLILALVFITMEPASSRFGISTSRIGDCQDHYPRPYLPMEGAPFTGKRCKSCFGAPIMKL